MNPIIAGQDISGIQALTVLESLRKLPGWRFLPDTIPLGEGEFP